ncbi:NAD+ kinase [Pilibacter termitis]|uniref:NAD kinase n=1 Tax=Pilibacter termitis TaxID=263852 RepID=A0A1T4KZQ5_9ENTE|nr:NAD kinase [Pilibacter termitis]SJZ47964.1 NAD+ kinase [Pilibacter termitis]
MKVAIVANKTEKTQGVQKEVVRLIEQSKSLTIDEQTPDIVISIGGDGTLLKAFHQYKHRLKEVEFVGVHTGHLGFYADWRDFELEEMVTSLETRSAEKVSYPLLEVEIEYSDGKESERLIALNESTVRRVSSTLVSDVYISGELFERFRGDGLSVSTPTGSTAYNKSVGGAVIHPSINAVQLAEIASLNNRVFRTLGSPMVLSVHEDLTIEMIESPDAVVTVDHLTIDRTAIARVHCRVASERIAFVSGKHTHFWTRVKESFIGVD